MYHPTEQQLLTWASLPDKHEIVESESNGEENEDPVIVATDAAGQPHAVVVKAVATATTQFTVFRVVWDYYLKKEKMIA